MGRLKGVADSPSPFYREWRKSGRRGLCQRDPDGDGAARRGDREGWTQSGLDGHQASAAQQADPEGSEQEEAELQGGVGVGRSQHGHAQLLPGEQEGDRVCKSQPEATRTLIPCCYFVGNKAADGRGSYRHSPRL